MKRVLSVLVASFLAGCATTPYVPPAGMEATATLSYVVTANDPVFGYVAYLHAIKPEQMSKCMFNPPLMAKINEGNPFLGETVNPPRQAIPAEAPFHVLATFAPGNALGQMGCRTAVEFEPSPGKDYVLSVHWDRTCTLKLEEVEGGARKEVPTRTESPFC